MVVAAKDGVEYEHWWDGLVSPPLTSPELITEVLPGTLYQSGVIEHWKNIVGQHPGIDTVIDLSGGGKQPMGFPKGPEYLYVHWPIRDNGGTEAVNVVGAQLPPVPTLKAVVALVINLINAGHVVLVHCKGGRNRSSLVLALVLMQAMKMDAGQAVDHLDSHRAGVFTNWTFVEALKMYERRV